MPVAVCSGSPMHNPPYTANSFANNIAMTCVLPIYEAAQPKLNHTCVIPTHGEAKNDVVEECPIPNYNDLSKVELSECTKPEVISILLWRNTNEKIFCTIPGKTNDRYHFISTTGNPIKIPLRCIPVHYCTEVTQQIQTMLEQGIIMFCSDPGMGLFEFC